MEEPRLSRVPTLSVNEFDIEIQQSNLINNQHNSSSLFNSENNVSLNPEHYGYTLCCIIFFGIIALIIYEYTTNKSYPA